MTKQLALLSICAIAAIIILAGSTEEADAAGFMKLGDIKGEATDKDHKDWINLLSVSHAIDTQEPKQNSARQRSSATFGDIVVVKEIDKSTPKLQEAIAQGIIFPELKIDFTRSSERGEIPYLQWELKNVRVTSYSFSGEASGDPLPTDQISLKFEEIKVTYTTQNSDGTKGKVEYSWKVEEGTK